MRTPLLSSAALDALTGGRVFLKPEPLQRTGSFKFRGAYNRLARIAPERRAAGVVAYSSGNHAQGVAAAAKLLGMPALIVMPRDTPALKRERTAALGAEIVLYDRDREDRAEIARRIAGERNATLVPPFDDPFIMAGQGTAGREIVEDLEALGLKPDIVIVPASGGGLIGGVALAVKERHPQARIVAAEPEGFDDHRRSLRSGKRERNARMSGSICDGLLTAEPGEITFEVTRRLVDEGVVASDDEVRRAMAFAYRELKLVVEPSGAIALAVLLAGRVDVAGKTVAVVLSGGNVEPKLFAEAIGTASMGVVTKTAPSSRSARASRCRRRPCAISAQAAALGAAMFRTRRVGRGSAWLVRVRPAARPAASSRGRSRRGRRRARLAPDRDHGLEPPLQKMQRVDHLAGALAGDVLERAGGIGLGRQRVDAVAGVRVGAALAQGPGDFLDLLGGIEDVGGRPLGDGDDGVELVGGAHDMARVAALGPDRGDLRLGAGDRVGHVDEVGAHALEVGAARLLGERVLEPGDGVEHEAGIGLAMRRAYSARNQRPRTVSSTAPAMVS